MGAVFFKEIRALFRSIYAIVSISVFAIAAGIIFVLNNVRVGYPSLDSIIATLSLIAAITIPIVACLSVNLERKRHDDEFLASLPLTTVQIVFGKFLALAVFFAVPTAVICLYPVILGFFGQVPYLYSYAAIFFLFVFELLVIALSMAFSAIFKKIWLAFVVTYSTLAVSFLLGAFSIIFPEPLRTIVRFISPMRRFDTVVYGRLDIPTLVFYVLFAALLLAICIRYASPKNSGARSKFKLSLSCAGLAVIMLVLSFLPTLLPAYISRIDVTSNKLYSTDGNTKQLFDGLEEEINVYLIDADGSEEKLVGFIESYCSKSSLINFEKVDTSQNKEFRDKYGFSQSANLSFCLVVESEKRHTVVGAEELFVWYNANYADLGYMSSTQMQSTLSSLGSMLDQYYSYYANNQMSNSDKEQYTSYMQMYENLVYYTARYLNAETALNEAIEYVTTDLIPTLYFIDGHGEKNSYANPLDITKLATIPKDAGMLIINTPATDYSASDVKMLEAYMNAGGRILVFANASNADMPNLTALLAKAGMTLGKDTLGENVKATVNTSSDSFKSLATNETLKLEMLAPTEVTTDTASGYEYTPLFTYDVEEQVEKEGENGETVTETKVVTKKIGAMASKNGVPVLTLVSGSDTFNVNASEIGEEDIENYSVSVSCLSAMVASMNRSFSPTVSGSTPKQYDTSDLLSVSETAATLVGTMVIVLIPAGLLGAGLLNIYTRKKRGSRAF